VAIISRHQHERGEGIVGIGIGLIRDAIKVGVRVFGIGEATIIAELGLFDVKQPIVVIVQVGVVAGAIAVGVGPFIGVIWEGIEIVGDSVIIGIGTDDAEAEAVAAIATAGLAGAIGLADAFAHIALFLETKTLAAGALATVRAAIFVGAVRLADADSLGADVLRTEAVAATTVAAVISTEFAFALRLAALTPVADAVLALTA